MYLRNKHKHNLKSSRYNLQIASTNIKKINYQVRGFTLEDILGVRGKIIS
jgi:hypothetical protein